MMESVDTRKKDPAEQPIAALATNPADRKALTALGRLGRSARHAAPTIIHSIMSVDDPRHRAVCFDVLASVLEDCEEDEAKEAVPLLARAIDDRDYRRMRGKIARTLLRIGLAARAAIPALARTLRDGAPGSVRVPTKAALVWLAWRCWTTDSTRTQEDVFLVLEGFSAPYRIWILDRLLAEDAGGSGIRRKAQRLRDELRGQAATE